MYACGHARVWRSGDNVESAGSFYRVCAKEQALKLVSTNPLPTEGLTAPAFMFYSFIWLLVGFGVAEIRIFMPQLLDFSFPAMSVTGKWPPLSGS